MKLPTSAPSPPPYFPYHIPIPLELLTLKDIPRWRSNPVPKKFEQLLKSKYYSLASKPTTLLTGPSNVTPP
jgi:hypothetical protein